MREWSSLRLENGILKRKKGVYNQLVVPRKLHHIIFRELHEEMGELESNAASKRTVLLAKNGRRYNALCDKRMQLWKSKESHKDNKERH